MSRFAREATTPDHEVTAEQYESVMSKLYREEYTRERLMQEHLKPCPKWQGTEDPICTISTTQLVRTLWGDIAVRYPIHHVGDWVRVTARNGYHRTYEVIKITNLESTPTEIGKPFVTMVNATYHYSDILGYASMSDLEELDGVEWKKQGRKTYRLVEGDILKLVDGRVLEVTSANLVTLTRMLSQGEVLTVALKENSLTATIAFRELNADA